MKTDDLPADAAPIAFTLDGKRVEAAPGETLLQVADRAGVVLPRLCASDGLRPAGNCRACVVEIEGERVLAPSCCRYPKDGMEVVSNNARALTSQKMSIELLLSDVPGDDPAFIGSGPTVGDATTPDDPVTVSPTIIRLIATVTDGDGDQARGESPHVCAPIGAGTERPITSAIALTSRIIRSTVAARASSPIASATVS